jgi:PAS domain S-box-containing protein
LPSRYPAATDAFSEGPDRLLHLDRTTNVTRRARDGTLSDITRVDAQRDPLAVEAAGRLASIVESSQDAIIGKTLDGVITSWNAGAEQLYGYRPDEIIGRNIRELIPRDRASELELVIERVTRGECVQPFETQRLTKDGRTLDMSVAISAIRDSSGTVTGASTVARDLTEIKRSMVTQHALEAQLHRVNDLLINVTGALRRRDLRDARLGQTEASQETLRTMPPPQPGKGADLTPRELEVLELMAQGLINKQVARLLGLRLNTVRNHSQHILYKLRAHSTLEAVATAVRDGIIGYRVETVVD